MILGGPGRNRPGLGYLTLAMGAYLKDYFESAGKMVIGQFA